MYRRRFIDQKRPVCVKGSHESLVSIWVQICQQNALTVNPFSPQGKQYKFTSGSKSPLTHTCLVLNGCRIFRHKILINEHWKLCVPHRENIYSIIYFISVRYAFMVYSTCGFFLFYVEYMLQHNWTLIQGSWLWLITYETLILVVYKTSLFSELHKWLSIKPYFFGGRNLQKVYFQIWSLRPFWIFLFLKE